MRLYFSILLILMCTASFAEEPSFIDPARKPVPIGKIKSITAASSVQEIFNELGPAKMDVGSGLHIYVWELADGSRLFINTAGDFNKPPFKIWQAANPYKASGSQGVNGSDNE